jgi:hypothetical protein
MGIVSASEDEVRVRSSPDRLPAQRMIPASDVIAWMRRNSPRSAARSRRMLAVALLLGWLLGLGTGVGLVALHGDFYEYRQAAGGTRVEAFAARQELINGDGWHIVPHQENPYYVRRLRLRWPFAADGR